MMNWTEKLKLLNDEIRRLFSEGVNENDACNQLSTDQRFESVRHTSVQWLYKKLQKDQEKEIQKQKLEERKRQLDEECKRMIDYRQKAKDLLLYEGLANNTNQCLMNVWQNRYLATEKRGRQIDNTRVLNFHDLLQNISKEISFQSVNCLYKIHVLNNNFILLDEFHFPFKLVRLAQVNLSDGTLQIIQEIKQHRDFNVVVDSSNLSKFLLCFFENRIPSVVVCKLIGEKIEIESEIEFQNVRLLKDTLKSYFNDQLLMFKFNEWSENLSNATIMIQGLDAEKKNKQLKLEPLPSNVCACAVYSNYFQCEWSGDHLFLSIQFRSTDDYGFAFIDSQTYTWTVLEFAISLPIEKLLVVNNYDLLVYTRKHRSESNEYLHNFYKLPMRKPELLRYKAWTKTVMFFKKKQAADPYEEARKYLPLTSDIRGPFAANQDVDDE